MTTTDKVFDIRQERLRRIFREIPALTKDGWSGSFDDLIKGPLYCQATLAAAVLLIRNTARSLAKAPDQLGNKREQIEAYHQRAGMLAAAAQITERVLTSLDDTGLSAHITGAETEAIREAVNDIFQFLRGKEDA